MTEPTMLVQVIIQPRLSSLYTFGSRVTHLQENTLLIV